MGTTYGFRIEWRPTPKSGLRIVSTDGHADMATAKAVVIEAAQKWGYRRRRWYEYWRWFEVVPSVEEKQVKHAAS